MAFYDYKEPIEYVVNNYFARKRFQDTNNRSDGNMNLQAAGYAEDSLPEIPCTIVKGDDGKAYKFIYGDAALLLRDEECDPVIWQEELVRDDSGKVTGVITTYPNGESVETSLVRDTDRKVTSYEYN